MARTIPMRVDLPDDPQVVALAAALGVPEEHVVGCLLRVWGLADGHAERRPCAGGQVEGFLRYYTPAALDAKARLPGLAAALAAIGWLAVHPDGLGFPRWDEHNKPAPKAARRAKAPEAADGDVVLVFPTAGSPGSWELRDGQVGHWAKLYPGLDVLGECQKALAWVEANAPKTARGMKAFLVRWLNKAQDGGRRAGGRQSSLDDLIDAAGRRVATLPGLEGSR